MTTWWEQRFRVQILETEMHVAFSRFQHSSIYIYILYIYFIYIGWVFFHVRPLIHNNLPMLWQCGYFPALLSLPCPYTSSCMFRNKNTENDLVENDKKNMIVDCMRNITFKSSYKHILLYYGLWTDAQRTKILSWPLGMTVGSSNISNLYIEPHRGYFNR